MTIASAYERYNGVDRNKLPPNKPLKTDAPKSARVLAATLGIRMWRKLIGCLLIIGSIAIVAITISIFRKPGAGVWEVLGPLILASLFLYQGRKYLVQPESVFNQPRAAPLSSQDDGSFDPVLRARLIEKLRGMNGPKIVPITEFFNGNVSEQGAIGPNLWPNHPGIPTFSKCFEELLQRPDVTAVYAEVAEIEPDGNSWPYTDRVYVFGEITDDAIKEHTKKLRPTEVKDRKDMFSPIKHAVRSMHATQLHVLWWD